DGLQKTREIVYRDGYGKRSDAADVVILITDGIPTIRVDDTINEANLLKDFAEIVVVGITNNVDINLLRSIASDPNAVVLIDDFNGLTANLDNVLSGICPDSTACSSNDRLDLAFILDSSGSVNEDDAGNWGRMLDFVVSVASTFTIGSDDTRIGVVIFGDEGNLELYLDSIYDANTLYDRIRSIGFLNQATNTADGLQKTREIVYRDGYGKRSDAADVVILITDGIPTIRVDDTINEANLLKDFAEIVVVGITNNVDINLLRSIASDPNAVVLIDDFNGLTANLDNVLSGICPDSTGWYE
ncbi:hypothetical protein CAPTEDRAFT_196658, partial [Capitella teleta]